MNQPTNPEGILLLDKEKGRSSFSIIPFLRKKLSVQKIGHAGTLDPFATGVMVMLIGRNYTRLSDQFLSKDKEYEAELRLGITTDTFDCDGQVITQSEKIPTLEEIQKALEHFQGEIEQIPPMFSAKKINGKKLYELARQGKEIEREAVKITVKTEFISYNYPTLCLRFSCSKGTYIRSIAHDLGQILGCGAHLTNLRRTKSGNFTIDQCITESDLKSPDFNLREHFTLTQNLASFL